VANAHRVLDMPPCAILKLYKSLVNAIEYHSLS
jgi:hypothetical protein